jgi:hypothetical protein
MMQHMRLLELLVLSALVMASSGQTLANTPGGVRPTKSSSEDSSVIETPHACNGTATGNIVPCIHGNSVPAATTQQLSVTATSGKPVPPILDTVVYEDSGSATAITSGHEAALVAADEAALVLAMRTAPPGGAQPAPSFRQIVLGSLQMVPVPLNKLFNISGGPPKEAAANWQAKLEGALQAGAATAVGVPVASVQIRTSSVLRLALQLPAPAPEFAAAAATALGDAIKGFAGTPHALASVRLAPLPQVTPSLAGNATTPGSERLQPGTSMLASVSLLDIGSPTAAAAAAEHLRTACPALLVSGSQQLAGSPCGDVLQKGQEDAAAAAARALGHMLATASAAPPNSTAASVKQPTHRNIGTPSARALLQLQHVATAAAAAAASASSTGVLERASSAAASKSDGNGGPWSAGVLGDAVGSGLGSTLAPTLSTSLPVNISVVAMPEVRTAVSCPTAEWFVIAVQGGSSASSCSLLQACVQLPSLPC